MLTTLRALKTLAKNKILFKETIPMKTVLHKLKLLIECNEWYDESESYADGLLKLVPDLPGYPKVEIDGDPAEDVKYVTSENYNEEKYELLDTESFDVVSADEDEVVISAGSDEQSAPLTFSIKTDDRTGKLHITDIYQGYSGGMTFDEFDDLIRNIY